MGINKVILVGNLGKDPELRFTPDSRPVANFPLATTERFSGRDGNRQEKTEWHNIVVWGKLAELTKQYLKKGRTVYLEGRITTRSWDDRDGNKKYRTEIVANQVEFLNSGSGQGSYDRGGYDQSAQPQQYAQPSASSPMSAPPNMGNEPMQGNQDNGAYGGGVPVEDDLPF